MFKLIALLVVAAGLTYFGLNFFGYEVRPNNISYYLPQKSEGAAADKNALTQYLDSVKYQNKIHPLIAKKKGASAADSLDKSSTGLLKQLTQADKFEQFERVKKQIKEVSDKANERDAIVKQAENI